MFNSEPMRLLETTKYSLSDYIITIVTSISRLLALLSAVSNFTIRAWRIK